MARTRTIESAWFLSALLVSAMPATVFAQSARNVGAGLSLPAPTQAAYINPAGLAAAEGRSIEGLWRFGTDEAIASFATQVGGAGLSAGYIGGSANTYFVGVGADLGKLSLGATLFNRDFEDNLDGDVGAILRLAMVRVGVAVRSIEGSVGRIDGSLGWDVERFSFDLAVKRPLPWDSGLTHFDASATMNAGPLGFGLGFYATRQNGEFDGDGLHASLVYRMDRLSLEGHYKFAAQEVSQEKWTVGARFEF